MHPNHGYQMMFRQRRNKGQLMFLTMLPKVFRDLMAGNN